MISRPSSRPRRFSGCSKTAFLWGQVVRLGALELGDDRLAFGHEASGLLLTGEGKDTEAEPATQAASTHQRSEEHTSELQSRPHLVCRLLLEKKKTNQRHDQRV